MTENERIIQIIDQKINTIKVKIREIKETTPNELSHLEPIIEELKKVQTNPKYLINISDEKLMMLDDFSLEIIELPVYKELLKNETFDFSQKHIEELNQICKNVISKFNTIKLNFKKNENEINKLSDDKKRLIELKQKVMNGYLDITVQDLQGFVTLFKHSNVKDDEILTLIKYITYKYIGNAEQVEIDNEVEELKETNLKEEDLINLFNSYGYDFNDLGTNTIEISKYGNLENIKNILDVLKDNNIDLNKKIVNSKVIVAKSRQLTEIFLKSNAINVLGVLNIAKEINLVEGNDIDFVYLLETPSRFLSRKKRYSKKKPSGGDGPELIDTYGCYEDFVANVELLKAKYEEVFNDGQFLNKVFKKCDSVFNHSNQQILNVIKIYDLYGIEPQYYLNSLSGLNSLKQAEVFDLAFELDIMDYIKDNMSKANLNPNNSLFKQIAIAKRNNIPNVFDTNKRETLVGEKTCLFYSKTYIEEYIARHQLTFERFDIKKIFNENEVKIFEEFENIITNQDNDKINLALDDLSSDENNMLKELEKYRSERNPNVYIINNTRISRLKVLRLYTTLKINGVEPTVYSFMYMLTKNSYITQEKFEQLFDTINGLINNKEKLV